MRRFLFAILLGMIPTAGFAVEAAGPGSGEGWTMTRLDLDVRVESEELSMVISGIMTLRLDAEESLGPTLWLNSENVGQQWISLEGSKIANSKLNEASPQSDAARLATVQLKKPASRGDQITLRFEAEQVGELFQLVSRSDIALASWVEGWYPVALTGPDLTESFSSQLISIPGITRFDLPGDWIALTDGRLVKREQKGGRTLEVWDLTDKPVARSFAAGAYRAAERKVDDRMIRIYLMKEHVLGVDRLAELIAASMAAQEKRLGAYPFSGYGVVEVPDGVQHWGAASQQTFIMAKSDNFDHEHGNLPLWAHEMCHGWWGNTVGTSGPGAKTAGEALAQYGVLISLETLEGTGSMIEFLEFSRSGYSVKQSARGYFLMMEQGNDHPLATLGESDLSGSVTHNLADSKGMWVYHMLRRKIGDERFFAALRGLIDDYAGRDMSLDDIRQAFIAVAPDQGLEQFFAQWLDRTGAPRIEATWSMLAADSVQITLSQTDDYEPFVLDLELELVFGGGTTRRETAHVRGRETTIVRAVPTGVADVLVDPDRDHLLWRPAYMAPPSVDGVPLSATAPWVEIPVYAGTYHIDMFNMDTDVFGNEEGLFVNIHGDIRQLYPHKPHRFLTHTSSVEFKVEDGKATGFMVELENGAIAEGVRLDLAPALGP